MKCLRNPMTGELKRVPEHEARKLAAYGWTYVTKGEWKRSVQPNLTAIKAQAASIAAEVKPKYVSGLPSIRRV